MNNAEVKTVAYQKTGFGAVLIRERKARGLTHLQVSEKTRIRPSILKALENEQWELLPQPVFVKGLIRSYAQAVGFEEKEVTSLYEKATPMNSKFSRPLIETDKIKRDFSFVIVFLILIIAAVYYIWKEYPSSNDTKLVGESMNSTAVDINKPEELAEINSNSDTVLSNKSENDILVAGSLQDVKPESSPEDLYTATNENVSHEILPINNPGTELIPEPYNLILIANIKSKTWIKVSVDEGDPEEYTFYPGSQEPFRIVGR
jgi:cytoskeleton protein RodZ